MGQALTSSFRLRPGAAEEGLNAVRLSSAYDS